jgi:hypothetical protein
MFRVNRNALPLGFRIRNELAGFGADVQLRRESTKCGYMCPLL